MVKIWSANTYHGQILAAKEKTGNYGKKNAPGILDKRKRWLDDLHTGSKWRDDKDGQRKCLLEMTAIFCLR